MLKLPYIMKSKWGVQMEGDEQDLARLTKLVNSTTTSRSSLFISMLDHVYVIRSTKWDDAEVAIDAFNIAMVDLLFIRGCFDALDGCGTVNLGTIYEFLPSGKVNMTRHSAVHVRTWTSDEDLSTPEQFGDLVSRASANSHLRAAFSDLTYDASWIDIYRCWESLRDYYGDVHKLRKHFAGEVKKLDLLSRTANSFRHVRTHDPLPNPMSKADAIEYLKDLLVRSSRKAKVRPPAVDSFTPGTVVHIDNRTFGGESPAALNQLALREAGFGSPA